MATANASETGYSSSTLATYWNSIMSIIASYRGHHIMKVTSSCRRQSSLQQRRSSWRCMLHHASSFEGSPQGMAVFWFIHLLLPDLYQCKKAGAIQSWSDGQQSNVNQMGNNVRGKKRKLHQKFTTSRLSTIIPCKTFTRGAVNLWAPPPKVNMVLSE